MTVGALLCLFLAAWLATAARAEGEPPWRVVIVRNWDSLYPVNVVREGALRQALSENAHRVIEVFPEGLDPLHFATGAIPEMVPVLQKKYAGTRVDVVIASGLEPLEFAVQHRDVIWPGAAIVFNGVVDGMLDGWQRPPRTTGVLMDIDVEGTLRAGLALVPQARRVYFISGTSRFDEDYLKLAVRHLGRLDRHLEAQFLTGLTRDEIVERVPRVEPDSLVMYLTVLRDAEGVVAAPGDSTIGRVARQSKAIVLAAVPTQWRRGPVGGSSTRMDDHGREAGLLVRRVLEGGDPDALPILSAPRATCEMDWAGLQRWAIPEHNVPAACRITGRPPSPWGRSLWLTLALVAVVLAQAALIWMLVLQSRRRRVAEAQLKARGAELAQLARLSTMGALTASIAHEINQPMGAILSNTEAAEIMLERGELKPDKLREILADIRTEDLRASHVITGLRKLLAQREPRAVPLDVNTEVAEALRHVTFEAARKRVALLPEFDRDIPPVLGDPVQLQEVVINLVMNAIDALADEPERWRELRVSTRAVPDGVQVVVADRGPGIAPQDEGRLFDAMFTTKKDGMGLGLSIVRAIVESFGGRVSHERNVPRGAVFRVWLPAIGR